MRRNNSKPERVKILVDAGLALGTALTIERIEAVLSNLDDVETEALRGAVRRHLADPDRGRFFPSPADIRSKLPRDLSGVHMGADAAWAIVVESFDERMSVLWTREMEAARAISAPVWDLGDKIGARMAFKSAYEAALSVTTAPPKWIVSVGSDKTQREALVQRATEAGLLGPSRANHLAPPESPVSAVMARVAGMIANGDKTLVMFPGQTFLHKGEPEGERENVSRLVAAMRDGLAQAEQAGRLREQEIESARVEARNAEESRRAELLAQAGMVATDGR